MRAAPAPTAGAAPVLAVRSSCGRFTLLFQHVADLGEEQLLLRGCRRSGRSLGLFPHEAVHELDHEEDAEGEDDEIHALLDEGAVVPVDGFRGRGLQDVGTADESLDGVHGSGGDVADLRDIEAELREVGVSDQRADRGHEDVVHERGDDLSERTSDDYADGHVHDIAFHGEFLEFLEESHIFEFWLWDGSVFFVNRSC